MKDINYLLVAEALIESGQSADVARRYRSIRKRQLVIQHAIARAASARIRRLAGRVNRLILMQRHLEPLLLKAVASLYRARFTGVVPIHALRDALHNANASNSRSVVLGFNRSSLFVDGASMPTLRGSGNGLAIVSRRHLRTACGLPGRVIVINVQLGFWGALTDRGAPLMRFPHFKLSQREVRM